MRNVRRLPVLHATATAADAMRRAQEGLDERMQERVRQTEATAGALSPCRKGCSHCCRQVVLAHPYEVAVVVEALRLLPSAQRHAIAKRLARWLKNVQQLGADPLGVPDGTAAYLRAGIACPLLDPGDGSCLVYAARPVACRTHQVVGSDPQDCKEPNAVLQFVRVLDLGERAWTEVAAEHGVDIRRDVFGRAFLRISLMPELLSGAWSLVEASEPDVEGWCAKAARGDP